MQNATSAQCIFYNMHNNNFSIMWIYPPVYDKLYIFIVIRRSGERRSINKQK